MIAMTISTSFVLALDKHDPKVYEEDTEETAPEVVRKARHHNDEYQPPIFVYDKATQPDLRKWRYYQQQQVDLKNMEQSRQRLQSTNGFANGRVRYRDEQQESIETKQSSRSVALEPKWKVVHPKFVTEKRHDFSPSELIRMQEEYGKRNARRVPLSASLNPDRRSRKPQNNQREDLVDKDQNYKVKEADLDVEASDIKEVHTPIARQDQISVVLPTNMVAKAIYVDPNAIARLVSTNTPADNTDAQNYYETNQRDVDALNSILGSTGSEQLNGLKEFLHSQSAHVAAPLPNQLSQNTHHSDSIAENVRGATVDSGVENPEIQRILQTKGQSIDEMQAQLNAVSQREGARAIAEAQQRALDYIQSQQRAIEYAQLEGRKVALDNIKTHNIQLPETLPQALALTQSQPQINDAPPSQNIGQQITIVQNTEDAPKIAPRRVDENTILHAQLQAQAYLQLASQNYGSTQQAEQIPNSPHAQVQNSQAFIDPEVNHNGLNGINVHHQPSEEGRNIHEADTPLSTQAYENLVAQAHALQTENLQKLYANSQNEHAQEKTAYEGKHDVSSKDEYAPKYSFGYRVMDYHTGTDYGHEEKRDGKLTNGRYHVLLPDGRLQRVNYWADLSGYHAKVTYSDVAHH